MRAVFRKEIRQFFSSLTGYIAIIVFLLLNGLFLFVFPDSSILDYGYATLEKFFDLAPWIFLLLIPAITMRSFSDEFRMGTFETLRTRPLTAWQLVLGKYFASLVVVGVALLPTAVYFFSVRSLSAGSGIDSGATLGSYAGLFLLGACFSAIGTCCSSFTGNAVVAFIAAAFFCFVFYIGFDALSRLPAITGTYDYFVEMAGIDFHYRSMSRGVIDTRDLVYFLTVIYFFLFLTKRNMDKSHSR